MRPNQTCPVCQRTQPLRQFRRIRRGKSRLHTLCNTCDPPKTLKQMTKRERLNALATTHKHISPTYVLSISDREKAHHDASVRPAKALRQWARARRVGWDEAVLKKMKKELHWARKAMQRYARNQEKYGERIKFLGKYWTTLKYIREQMEVESKRFNTPTIPTPDQANPRTYITKEEYHDLKTNYAVQYLIPGAYPAREPWFLSWQDPEEQTGKKSSPDQTSGGKDE